MPFVRQQLFSQIAGTGSANPDSLLRENPVGGQKIGDRVFGNGAAHGLGGSRLSELLCDAFVSCDFTGRCV